MCCSITQRVRLLRTTPSHSQQSFRQPKKREYPRDHLLLSSSSPTLVVHCLYKSLHKRQTVFFKIKNKRNHSVFANTFMVCNILDWIACVASIVSCYMYILVKMAGQTTWAKLIDLFYCAFVLQMKLVVTKCKTIKSEI